ncbi:MAG TPA: hypothetical protein VG455_10105 [Acidimicrobiales bacterium]|nr:hypothetical protein [Acidimicrobiales bacterium]
MILVGGVGQLWQGDLDLGRRAAERLALELAGPDVYVEDLYYGAVAVAQRLDELRPEALVVVGATSRGRPPGIVEVRTVAVLSLAEDAVQLAVADAVTGYVAVDLLLEVAGGLGALPPVTVVVDVEPATVEPGDDLSPEATAALEQAMDMVRAEVAALRPAGPDGSASFPATAG